MTPAVVYCRFSPRPGAEQCDSNRTQFQRIRAYCQANDYQIVLFSSVQFEAIGSSKVLLPLAETGLAPKAAELRSGHTLICHFRQAAVQGVAGSTK
jgi:hypothetical protein